MFEKIEDQNTELCYYCGKEPALDGDEACRSCRDDIETAVLIMERDDE